MKGIRRYGSQEATVNWSHVRTRNIEIGYKMFSDYQSAECNTEGAPAKANRSIPDRVKEYGILDYVNKDSAVLDLGCNRGYFGVHLSPNISHYVGIDSDKFQLQYGINECLRKGITNVNYSNTNYYLSMTDKYDIIFCFAFHIYVGVSMAGFAKHLINILNPNGHLFLEGHPKGYHLPNSTINEPEWYWNPFTSRLFTSVLILESKNVKDR